MNKSTLFQPRSSSGLLFGEADGAWVITTYLEKGPSAVPIALCCRQQSRRVFYTGAHHRALRHPRKARLLPRKTRRFCGKRQSLAGPLLHLLTFCTGSAIIMPTTEQQCLQGRVQFPIGGIVRERFGAGFGAIPKPTVQSG